MTNITFQRGDHVSVDGYNGIAFYVDKYPFSEPDEDTEWTGYEHEDYGLVVCVMVGDDHKFTFDIDDLTPLEREEFCGECGQIGCFHDGLDRE
jgi:hypothetical protein